MPGPTPPGSQVGLVWRHRVGLAKPIWTSHPDNKGARSARTLGAKPHEPGAAPRKSMPMATHPARGGANGKRGTGSLPHGRQPPLSLCPRRLQRSVNDARANHAPMSPPPVAAGAHPRRNPEPPWPVSCSWPWLIRGKGDIAPIPPATQGGAHQLCGRMKISGRRQWSRLQWLFRSGLFRTPVQPLRGFQM